MKHLMYLTISALLILTAGCGEEFEWREFEFPEGGFKALMPGEVRVETHEVASLVDTSRTITLTSLDVQFMQALFIVSYNRLDSTELADPEEFLKQTRDRAVQASDGKLIEDREITLQGYPGRKIHLQRQGFLGQGNYYARIFIAHDRIYQVVASTMGGRRSLEEAAKRFLNSFKFLQAKPDSGQGR
ncbi:hypothetical protein GF359_03735 [candidate division WOR-3 bacterium]|uniref:Uncharacterized protein n=1 Tax=candidate division WOR-3 bacterium TaxID=2052148 RepID=A0A9D5K8K3_UNCW3|nr:hypothetical protein [candidate division WOR-3 bacterium]MBD3364307.1 hypothetical protein [candidate division WOR-3 bacterium]